MGGTSSKPRRPQPLSTVPRAHKLVLCERGSHRQLVFSNLDWLKDGNFQKLVVESPCKDFTIVASAKETGPHKIGKDQWMTLCRLITRLSVSWKGVLVNEWALGWISFRRVRQPLDWLISHVLFAWWFTHELNSLVSTSGNFQVTQRFDAAFRPVPWRQRWLRPLRKKKWIALFST